MPKINLTKTAVETASPGERVYELRDTVTTGFLLKVTPAGGKVSWSPTQPPKGKGASPPLVDPANSPSNRPDQWSPSFVRSGHPRPDHHLQQRKG